MNSSNNWIPFSSREPTDSELTRGIWVFCQSHTTNPIFVRNLYSGEWNDFWQPATPPDPPQNQDEEAFIKAFGCRPGSSWNSLRDGERLWLEAQRAWHAALAWERARSSRDKTQG